jgi:hypothetical protein
MPIRIHPYYRDKERAMESAGLTPAVNSVGYTVQEAAESADIVNTPPTILVGSNWFFGGMINQSTGQTHTD